MLVWSETLPSSSNTGGCSSTLRSGEGGGGGGGASSSSSSSSSFLSIMSMVASCVLDGCMGDVIVACVACVACVVCDVFVLCDDIDDALLRCGTQFPAAAGTMAISSELRRRYGMALDWLYF